VPKIRVFDTQCVLVNDQCAPAKHEVCTSNVCLFGIFKYVFQIRLVLFGDQQFCYAYGGLPSNVCTSKFTLV